MRIKASLLPKKKISIGSGTASLFTVSPACTHTFTPLGCSTNWHKTQQHRSSGAITWLAGGRFLLLSSHNSPWSPVFQHGGGYSTGMARPLHIPLLDQGVRPRASQASGTASSRGRAHSIHSTMGTWLRVPLPWVGFGHSMAASWLGSFGQAFPIIVPLLSSSCKLHRSGALFFWWVIYNIKSNNK